MWKSDSKRITICVDNRIYEKEFSWLVEYFLKFKMQY